MEHSLHLAAKHLVESITPLSRETLGGPASGKDSDKEDTLSSGNSLGKQSH